MSDVSKNELILHQPEAGDWTVAYFNGEKIYEGHSGLSDLDWSLLEVLNVDYKTIVYDDEEYQEKF